MITKIIFILIISLYLCVWIKFRNQRRFLDIVTPIVFLLYVYLVLSITMVDRANFSNTEVSLVPLYSYYGILTKGWNGEGYYIAQSLLGNVILFLPIGIVFSIFFEQKRNRLLVIILCALLVSLSIEVVQYNFRLGTFEVDDLIHNTLGAVFGSLIAESIKLIELHNKQTYQLAAKKLKPLFMFLLFFGIVCFISVIHLCIVHAF